MPSASSMSIYTSVLALNALPIASAVGGRIRRNSTAMPLRMAAVNGGGQKRRDGKEENDQIMSRMKPGASNNQRRKTIVSHAQVNMHDTVGSRMRLAAEGKRYEPLANARCVSAFSAHSSVSA